MRRRPARTAQSVCSSRDHPDSPRGKYRPTEDFAPLAQMMSAFEAAFGPYPFSVYTVVVTPDELAHQWFGNSVGLRRWHDICLNEGFACYAEWIWSEASGGASAHAKALAHHARLARLDVAAPLSDPGADEMFDDWVYKRGALTLHALRLTIGGPGPRSSSISTPMDAASEERAIAATARSPA